MQEEFTNEELYDLYREFNRDFRIANPEVEMGIFPSLEGFEFWMQNLTSHPEEKDNLVRMWKQGWAATQNEISLALSKINFLSLEGIAQYETFMKKQMSHLKFM